MSWNDVKSFIKEIDVLRLSTGFSIIIVFLSMSYVTMFLTVPEENREAFAHLRGMIDGAFVTGLVGYYFVKSKPEKPE
jgi:hypothetical protein